MKSASDSYDNEDFHNSIESCKKVLTYRHRQHKQIPRSLRRRVKHDLCKAYSEAAIVNISSVQPFDVLEACEDALSEIKGADTEQLTPDDAPAAVECRIRIAWAWIFQHQEIGKAKYEIQFAESISRQHPDVVNSKMRYLHRNVQDRIREEEEEIKRREKMESDLYGLLGLLRNATISQIKKAYRK